MTENKNNRLWGIICVVLASMCYGITPILSNTALRGGLPEAFLKRLGLQAEHIAANPANAIPNESVVGFGMALACVICLAHCLVKRVSLRVTRRQTLEMAVYGGGGFTATMLLISYAYLSIPAGTTIVINFTYPVLVAVFSALIFKERFRIASGIALALAIAGIALISGLGAGDALGENPALGIPLALLSGLAYAVYFLAGRHASYSKTDTSVANVYITGSAAVICFVIALLTGRFRLPPTVFLWIVLLSSAVLGYIIGLRLLLVGIRLLGSSTASALNTLEPVFASLTSVVVLGESMNAVKITGAALVLAGALMSILAERKD